MDVPGWVWGLTILGIVGLLVFDFFFHVREAHVPTLREAAIWSSVYVGLALAFGVLHALHENNLPFINNGEPVDVVEISTGLSLTVILGVLVVTVVASLISPKGKAQTAIANARRHAAAYLDSEYTADPAERERIYRRLLDERDQIIRLGPQYRLMARSEQDLMSLVDRARASHDAAVVRGEAAAETWPPPPAPTS